MWPNSQETGFLMFLGNMGRDQLHEMGWLYCNFLFPFTFSNCLIIIPKADAYSESCQIAATGLFPKLVNDVQSLTIFEESSVLDVRQGSVYVSAWVNKNDAVSLFHVKNVIFMLFPEVLFLFIL